MSAGFAIANFMSGSFRKTSFYWLCGGTADIHFPIGMFEIFWRNAGSLLMRPLFTVGFRSLDRRSEADHLVNIAAGVGFNGMLMKLTSE